MYGGSSPSVRRTRSSDGGPGQSPTGSGNPVGFFSQLFPETENPTSGVFFSACRPCSTDSGILLILLNQVLPKGRKGGPGLSPEGVISHHSTLTVNPWDATELADRLNPNPANICCRSTMTATPTLLGLRPDHLLRFRYPCLSAMTSSRPRSSPLPTNLSASTKLLLPEALGPTNTVRGPSVT